MTKAPNAGPDDLESTVGASRPDGNGVNRAADPERMGEAVGEKERQASLDALASTENALERIDRELRRNEARFRSFFETPAVGTAELSLDGRFLAVNDRFCEMTGYAREELIGRGPGVLAWTANEEEERGLSDYLDGKSDLYRAIKRYRRKDGEALWVQVDAAVVHDAEGRPLWSSGIIQDITERKQADDALHAALADAEEKGRLLEALMEQIPEGITIADAPDVRIRMVSRYGRELAGKPREVLEGVSFGEHAQRWEIYAPDGVAMARDEDLPLTRATQRGEVVRDEEWMLGNPAGDRIPILCNAGPIRDASGAIVGGVIAWHDIRERKETERLRESEERLRESESTLSAVLEALPVGVVIADAKGRIVRDNLATRELWGVPPDTDSWEKYSDWIGWWPETGERIKAEEWAMTRALQSGEETRNELIQNQRFGSEQRRYYLNNVVPLRDAEGRIVGGVAAMLDVTERRRAELALQEANERLREADQRKNEFLAVLSHELRNPLAPVRNSLYILGQAAPGGEQARRAQAVIERQVTQLARLVDDLLDVTRITRGKISLKRERVDLNELSRRTVEDHRTLFANNGVGVELIPAPSEVWVSGDRARLAQVVGNLLQNSAKFTPHGGSTTVSLAAEASAGHAVITVHDTGGGIAPELVPHLFESFVQADTSLDRSKGGLGLGLALVKGLVEMHGGSVSAASGGTNQGATFRVRLPLDGAAVSSSEPAPRAPGEREAACRVLIIEDNLDAADSLRDALELGDHEVEVAYSGSEGLEKARSFRPDAVLCDIGLPEMDGYAVARAFRADEALRHARLVALTGYAQPEDVAKARTAGFDSHLAKPPKLEDIEDVLGRIPSAG